MVQTWQFWAFLSAVFAALTAVFGKIGVQNINSDMATLIRTIIILAMTAAIVVSFGHWQKLETIPGKTWVFLLLSGLATGASWLCYFRALQMGPASQVAPIDKLSVVMVALFAALFLGEKLAVHNWLGVALIGVGAVLVAIP
ncbi:MULTISPECIES: EamA family transporter [unclassified Devosia]|uniref:EamA family transporter n=1 Tax=unclassified Devosia TaxID=196773 RepID=UPI00145C99AC|nr:MULTISPECIES: EamA family transporter [unclassified Devosia]MBJ6986595.1 EamA family transporter [Devosia sp. MC521]MBK1793733.1 EamA family transporter [Devosia sp. WQ 349K1]QMW61636.1 EamA family transporter [Devosia sp. MC521]